jgi:hypothetical protein
MCAPAALAVASIAATAIGTAVQMQGQRQAGKAAMAQAEYQAAVGRNNAILAQRAANDARARGEVAAADAVRRGNQLIGRQRAILAGNGVLVDEGSALDLTSETAGLNKLDELTIRSNAEREALGYEAQGMNFKGQAEMDLLAGTSARSAANTAAFGTALSGIGSVATKWYDFNRAGAFSGGGRGAYGMIGAV